MEYLALLFFVVAVALWRPQEAPRSLHENPGARAVLVALGKGLLPPVFLIVAVLGSILGGFATPTEAASIGALGAILLAGLRRKLTGSVLHEVSIETLRITAMVYLILVGATVFSSVFRGFGGDSLIAEVLMNLPGGVLTATFIVMLLLLLAWQPALATWLPGRL